MGTNFYWIENPDDDEGSIKVHIGKRSAAGLFCWDCGVSKCESSTDVHRGKDRMEMSELEWCPGCGKSFDVNKTDWNTTSGVELGFAKSKSLTLKGIGTCCSFTWSMLSHKWKLQSMIRDRDDRKVVRDEYGQEYTAREFLREELCGVAFESILACHGFC